MEVLAGRLSRDINGDRVRVDEPEPLTPGGAETKHALLPSFIVCNLSTNLH